MVTCCVLCLQPSSVLHLSPVRTVLGITVWGLWQENDPVISQNVFRNSNTFPCDFIILLWESSEEPVFLLICRLEKNYKNVLAIGQ